MNNTQKSFYILTIISVLIHAYGLLGQAIHLFQGSFLNWSNFGFIATTITSIFFTTAGVIGVIKFVTDENFYNKWLKAYALMAAFYFVLYLPYNFSMMTGFHPAFKNGGIFALGVFFLFQTIFSLIYFIVIIKHFSSEQKVFTHGPSIKKEARFAHYLIDGLFIAITGFNFINSLGFLGGLTHRVATNGLVSYMAIFFTLLVYYIVSEGIFKQSFGKLVTNHYVAHSNGSKANFGNIVIRSLCRFIPFEIFSYLTSPMAKWHDKFSGTDVFEDFKTGEVMDYNNEYSTTTFDSETFDPGNWEE